jgi:hypothetical protein
VEILGLVQIAADSDAIDFLDEFSTGTFEAIRPDGSRRSFTAPRMVFTTEHVDLLEGSHDE